MNYYYKIILILIIILLLYYYVYYYKTKPIVLEEEKEKEKPPAAGEITPSEVVSGGVEIQPPVVSDEIPSTTIEMPVAPPLPVEITAVAANNAILTLTSGDENNKIYSFEIIDSEWAY